MERAPLNIVDVIDGISFPAEKVDIIAYAADQDAGPEAMNLLRAMPAGGYNSMEEINAALGLIEEEPGQMNLWPSKKAR
ncbi:DUF2795 domain-containing protein [uncultured Sneathiella sp.]|uniref:DUF2795 domain-containing protein n=1 Tax=uncultured Sneathiella sp. TaxID=879315 RepID=UPI0030D9FAC5|tara:strand:+ start:408 stop:644 length:237 start_codon:yes stop_codon:yes gene_type:complete